MRAETADNTIVGLHFVLVTNRFSERSMRKQRLLVIVISPNNESCWWSRFRAFLCHEHDFILRIGEEMLRCNFRIAATANFVVLSVGFGWPWPHRFRHHVTWLILPVVICLSQRLSHACLSISVSLRNCEWLIKTVIVSMSVVYYLDIHGNSRANTCVQTRLLRKGCAY